MPSVSFAAALGRSLISLRLPPGQDTQYKLYYHHATLHMHCSVKRVIQNVHFIPSPNMTALSVRRPAFPNICRDSCGAQCDYKSETLCVPVHMSYRWFTNREQGRVGMVSSDAKPYMCEMYRTKPSHWKNCHHLAVTSRREVKRSAKEK